VAHVAVNAGELNRLITVNSIISSADTFGQAIPTLASVKQVWAAIRSLSGSEQVFGNHVNGFVTHEIETHYDSAFAFDSILSSQGGSSMVITYGNRKFHVESVQDVDDANIKMIWLCAEIRN